MNIAVIGAGTVGLATAAIMVTHGHVVLLVEHDPRKHQAMLGGEFPTSDARLAEVLNRAWARGGELCRSLSIFDSITEAKDHWVSCVFICVGTPSRADGSADILEVEEAAREVRRVWPDAVIAVRSTTPPGTCKGLGVAHVPEFLREGLVFEDVLHPSRIVIGVGPESEDWGRRANVIRDLFLPLNAPIIMTTQTNAEMIKYASNCFLAMKISYANMIGDICGAVGADVELVADGMGADPRIGRWGLDVGLGFGGSCLGKDTRALVGIAEEQGVNATLLRATLEVNGLRIVRVLDMIAHELRSSVMNKVITVLGLAFKPGVPDTRDSQSVRLARSLQALGAVVRTFDPAAPCSCDTAEEALQGADCAVIATPWPAFRHVHYPEGLPVVDPWRLLR